MKEEKENQKKKEEKINLKEAKEKKVSKKAVKTKDEATDKKVVKKAPAKKDTAKEKAVSDEKKPKKTTAKKKVKKEEATKVVSNNDAIVEAEETAEKTKANNLKLEENIAKLKGNKPNQTSDAKNDAKKISDIVTKEDEGEEIIIDAPKTASENQVRKERLEEQAEQLEQKKKRKNSIITLSIIAALIVIIVVVITIIGSLNSTTVESHEFYQWYSGQKVEYKGELTFTRKEGITELKATDRKVTLDSTPVYYADETSKVIFPEDMAVVYPNNNGMMYRINHFADVVEENGEIYLETNLATTTNRTKLEKAFLYDGQDLYFFLERTNITVNGTTYEVSPLSYAIVRYKQSVEIYNYEKDEYQVIDTTETQDAKVVTDTYTINMGVDSLQTAEKEQLLIKGLSYLQEFGTTEETK